MGFYTTNLLARYACQQGADPTVLYDSSGNAYDGKLGFLSGAGGATYRPTWASRGLVYDGATRFCELPLAAATGMKSFLVAFKSTATPGRGGILLGDFNFNTLPGVSPTDNRPGLLADAYGNPVLAGSRRYVDNAVLVFAGVKDGSNVDHIYINGIEQTSYVQAQSVTTNWNTATLAQLMLGSNYSGGYPITGEIYYAASWSASLTAQNVLDTSNDVIATLAQRGVRVTSETEKDDKGLMVFLGTSIARGVGDAVGTSYTQGGYPTLVTASLASAGYNYTPLVLAVGGSGVATITSQLTALQTELARYPNTTNVVVLDVGTNDSFSPGSIYNNLVAAVQTMLTWNNPPVIVAVTGLPRTGTDTNRATWNAQMRAQVGAWTAVADWGSDALMGQNGQNSNATYYGDTLHPTHAGYLIGETYVTPAVLTAIARGRAARNVSVSDVAAAVRTNLATELGRIDAAVSSRHASGAAVSSVTGSVGSVAGNLGGNVNGNVAGSVASVTGNVGGNVVGSVASVAGSVGGNVGGTINGLTSQAKSDVAQAVPAPDASTIAAAILVDPTKKIATNAQGEVRSSNPYERRLT